MLQNIVIYALVPMGVSVCIGYIRYRVWLANTKKHEKEEDPASEEAEDGFSGMTVAVAYPPHSAEPPALVEAGGYPKRNVG